MLATFLHGNIRACDGPQALMNRVHEVVDAAGMAGVNVLCLQEAWTMPFAYAPQLCCLTPFVYGVCGYGVGVLCLSKALIAHCAASPCNASLAIVQCVDGPAGGELETGRHRFCTRE